MNAPPVQYVNTSDGYSIAYNVAGNGRTILMMPYPFSHATLSWTVAGLCDTNVNLAAKFRVVHFDMRGQGLSSRGLHDSHRLEDYLLDIEAIVQALGLDRFLLFSPVVWKAAVAFASKHPERIEALILLDPLGNIGASTEPHRLAKQAADDWDTFLMMVGSAFNPAPADTASRLSLRDRLKECIDVADYLKLLTAIQTSDGREWLSALKVPSLVIRPGAPWSSSPASEIAAAIPGAKLLLLEESGNMLYSSTGETPAGVAAVEEFVAGLPAAQSVGPAEQAASGGLSQRELEVLRLLAAGKSNGQIADELVISLNTVNRHVSNIYAKTGAANRAEAASFAARHGII